jgi:hypothetical protein
MRFRAEFENFSEQDAASARLHGFLPFNRLEAAEHWRGQYSKGVPEVG